jgi:23S rRNA pseudouridine2605 synthase
VRVAAVCPLDEARRAHEELEGRQSTGKLLLLPSGPGLPSAHGRRGRRGAVRLNAWLARAGVASRRGADELIKAGRVTVNGEPGRLNTFVQARDEVRLDGAPLAKQRVAYVLLHKPAGVVTTARDPQGRPTVVDLVDHEARVVPVGRLDADTTGALLLTNDGDLAHRLAHPRYGVDKVYVADTWKQPDDAALARLRAGVELEDGRTAPAGVRRLGGAAIERTIHEGRNRQVKRMFEAVGHRVRRLHRSRFGPLTVEGLEPGAWRELQPSEVEALRRATAR